MAKDQVKNDNSWVLNAIVVLVIDVLALWASFFAALILRHDFRFSTIPDEYIRYYIYLMPLWSLFLITVFYIRKIYRSIWRFVGIEEATAIVTSYFILAPVFVISSLLINMRMPISFYVVGSVFSMMAHVIIRFSYRLFRMIRNQHATIPSAEKKEEGKPKEERVMIIGGGDAGSILVRELKNNPMARQVPVCIIDDSPNKIGRDLYGVHIIGGREMIFDAARDYKIDTIILAVPS
ncbi:MAG: hypothetical protein IKE53_06110, partial [Clostridiales bacterium]|nr:hypothetical protein [Clostridiales bacterium]